MTEYHSGYLETKKKYLDHENGRRNGKGMRM